MNDMHSDQRPTAYVVDDDESIRALWRWLMESNGIAVKTFATAAAFIESYRSGDAGCLVLDLKLPGMSGLELQQYLNRKDIEIPIVFVTGHGDVPAAVSALKGGAVDLATLTEREREVLQRVIEGKPNKIIAGELDISMKTVEFHRAKVMEKMGVTSVAELVQIAMQQSE